MNAEEAVINIEEEKDTKDDTKDAKDIKDDTKDAKDIKDDIKDAKDDMKDTKDEVKEENDDDMEEQVMLQLGDVIFITDPTNEILNDNTFLIEYIDDSKMKIINSETFDKTTLTISPEGIIGDGSITGIKIVSTNPKHGYARQNDLLPGTWVNIYFGGDIPTVITGKITNLEEDMIEIRTTDDDTIFINFAYHGIPEYLPIETFEIRPAIANPAIANNVEDGIHVEDGVNEDGVNEEGVIEEGEEEKQREGIVKDVEEIPVKTVKDNIKRMFFDMNDIEFGDVINVNEYIAIDKEKKRFNIETQTNDLLEELISTVPNHKRTNKVLNNIHMMITRFLQLREISSTFDVNNNVNGIIKRSPEDRPLAEYLSQFKNRLYWIMMVAKNVKKIYDKDMTPASVDDVEIIPQIDEMKELESLYVTSRSRRTIKIHHSTFTYKSIDNYFAPFNPPSITDDIFNDPNGIIIEGNVESNLNAIIDNLGDFYSTVIGHNSMVRRRFIIQKYNLADTALHADSFKGSKFITTRIPKGENDTIAIKSIVTLPESAVRFSQIQLPGSDLLVKANLNMNFLNYWQMLKQKTSVTNIVVDGLDNEISYDENNFVDNIKHYMLNLTDYNKPNDLTKLDIYKIFLKTIIPKIRVLFSLVKKYIKGRLSLIDVINYLEPFLIYPMDLTYTQYREINYFIYGKIKEYNIQFKELKDAFSQLRNPVNKRLTTTNIINPLYNILPDHVDDNYAFKRDILKLYGLDGEGENKTLYSASESLKKIITSDYGRLFNASIALSNIKLSKPNIGSLENIKDVMTDTNACTTYTIAKKYYSKKALDDDNGISIYFDKEYDTTNYSTINNYKKQQESLTEDELILFLTEEFKKKKSMNEVDADYLATTLVKGAKSVKDGDYAILSVGDADTSENIAKNMEYFIRRDNKWIMDKDVDPNTFAKSADVLCNLNYSCIYDDKANKCETTDMNKKQIQENTLKQIVDQFDANYSATEKELTTTIANNFASYAKIYDKMQLFYNNEFYKYNNMYYNIGMTLNDTIHKTVVSPYLKLRNLIVGQNDFIKRQTDIIKFVSLYCYEGNPSNPNIHDGEMENEWWLYCNETNTKLLPKFHYILANTFINNNSKYDDVLNELKRKIGKRSDDGDAWVDENSGEVICYIDLDEEEYGRDVIEKDAGEAMLDDYVNKTDKKAMPLRLSPEGNIISNVVSILSSNMGIDIENSREFIIRVVTELMSDTKIIEKEPAYKKREDEAAKKGKKLPSYGQVYSSTILYLTLGAYLISIQTSIPSIRTKKTAPGCVRSFTGFPFEGEGDDSSLQYVACVALKSRDPSTVPWNVLPKNEEKITLTVKTFITKYLLPYTAIVERIKDKTEYLLTNPVEFIPEDHSVALWSQFLPPLKPFHVTHLENISDGFTDELQTELFNGNKRQLEKILVIQSKIIAFSLAIQEAIGKLVMKKDLLLKSAGQYFMDNACCNDNNDMTALTYFSNDDNSINVYNNTVKHLTGLLHDIHILTKSATMLSDINTKRIYPEINNDFSEDTIYQTFIILCKYQSAVPLTEDIQAICVDKPDYLNKMESLKEKIAKLKRDGRNYTKQQFLRLFQIVSRKNIINISLNKDTPNCIDYLHKLLDKFDELNDEDIPTNLTQKLQILVSQDKLMDTDTKEMRQVKDYLQTTNDSMRRSLIDFIKLKSKINASELRNITKFINELGSWNDNKRNDDIKITDDNLYNYVSFMKNHIQLFTVVFPSIIIHKNIQFIQNIEPPVYWELSGSHIVDVCNMIREYYKPLEQFYGDESIVKALREIIIKSRSVYLLSLVTPVNTNIKIDDKELYTSFDKRITMLLYEFYMLSIMNDYIMLTKNAHMVSRVLHKDDGMYSNDFLLDRQLQFSESEQEFIEGDLMKLNHGISKLLTVYLTIMMKAKKTINVSYDDIQDKVFKSKEAEKYDFTDKLRDMTDEERVVDTMLKHHKLGPLYSLGLAKGVKEYDPEHFEHDKLVAENVARIQNKLKKQGLDMDVDDAIEEARLQHEIDMDNMDMNMTDDYNDGDPWGEELDDRDDYD